MPWDGQPPTEQAHRVRPGAQGSQIIMSAGLLHHSKTCLLTLAMGRTRSFGDVRLNVRFARKRTRLVDLWARRYRVGTEGLALSLGALARLAQNEEPGGSGGEARG